MLALSLILVSFFVVAVPVVQGQLTIGGTQSKIALKIEPAQPRPFDELTIIVESFSTDLNRASIEWFIDGKSVQSGKGDKELKTIAPALGAKKEIRVVAGTADIGTLRVTAIIRPAEVNLLFQANTYTPPFYKGKALPTHKSGVRVVAIPNLVTSAGAKISAKDAIYTWKENGTVQGDKSGRGKDSYAVKEISIMRGHALVSVEVSSPDRTVQAAETIVIRPQTPKIVLYENNPLEGIKYNKAITGTYSLVNEEVTLQAIPYFFGVLDKEASELQYKWSLNNQPVEAAEFTQSGITLQKGEESGTAKVLLQINHKSNVFEVASRSFLIEFGNTSPGFFPTTP